MDINSTPTQRKQIIRRPRQAISTQQNKNKFVSTLSENEMMTEQLGDKWEKESHERLLIPQEEWQLKMNRQALVEERKTHPETVHALYIASTPAPPGTLERLRKMVTVY
jgi:hypothetical protein